MLGRNDKPPDTGDTHGISGNVFVNPPESSSSPCPRGFNPWIPNVAEHISPHVTSEMRDANQDRQPEKSFGPNGGRFSKDYGADHQRLQISDLHFDKFPTPTTFVCWKMRFKTEVCTCSQFPTEADATDQKKWRWFKQVDDLKSSRSVEGTLGPDFELLDARIASALNKNHPE